MGDKMEQSNKKKYDLDGKEVILELNDEHLTDDEVIRIKQALRQVCDGVSETDAQKFIQHAEDSINQYGSTALLRCQFEIWDMINTFFQKAELLEDCISVYETDVHYKTHLPKFDNIEEYATFMAEYSKSIMDKFVELNNQLPLIKQKIDEGINITKHAEKMAKNTYDIVRKSDENARKYMQGLSIALVESKPPTTIEEAKADAKSYYMATKKNREELENVKKDLPKTAKIKARIQQANKENETFIASCRSNTLASN